MVFKELLALPVLKVSQVLLVVQELQDQLVFKDLLELLVPKDCQVQLVAQELPDQQVFKDLLDLLVLLEQLVIRVCPLIHLRVCVLIQ